MPSSSIDSLSLNEIWAKSTGESLSAHTLRVLTNLGQIRGRSPDLDRVCEERRFWLRMRLAVAVHDLGKCCDGFQVMLRDGERFRHRHEVLSVVVLPHLLGSDPEGDLPWVAAAVLTHHKDWSQIDSGYMFDASECFDSLDHLRSQLTPVFFDRAFRVLRGPVWDALTAGEDVPHTWTEAVNRDFVDLAPVSSLRSVFRSVQRLVADLDSKTFPDVKLLAGRFARGVILLADHSGSAGEDFRIAPQLSSVGSVTAALKLPEEAKLHPHQLEASNAIGNLILKAPTGSGKTEAALLWAARQSSGGPGNPVLFYVLPFQASLNAMRNRVGEIFQDSRVTLQHSRAVLALYTKLLDRDYSPSAAATIASKERALGRLYVTPVRITTPYQLLKGAFQLRGHEALWTDATSGLFVFDEIHAYEPERLALILAAIRHLTRDLGARVLVMSATMPTWMQTLVGESLCQPAVISAAPRTFAEFRRHTVHVHDQDLMSSRTLCRIAEDFTGGKAVLVVATTVARAQEINRRLVSDFDLPSTVLHGRFHPEDRFKKELELIHRRGVNAEDPKPVLLVATQVVEVSLNVDFDVLYSDPAPLEALLQRFGRVNRARKHLTCPVHIMSILPEGCPVYSEMLLSRTLGVLRPLEGCVINEAAVQSMLDEIYQEPIGEQYLERARSAIANFDRDVLATARPFRSDEAISDLFDEMFDGFEVLPAKFEGEYQSRMEYDPILAPALLVPVSKGQFFRLRSSKRLRRGPDVWIAGCPYTEEGLRLDLPLALEGV